LDHAAGAAGKILAEQKIVAQGIKIKATAIHRQIGRPVVLHPTILNELAGFALNRLTVRIEMPKPDKDLVLSWITLPVLPEKFWQN
jgi:hypothetical protein